MKNSIPQEVSNVIKTLKEAGFEGYLVGGCVRDLLLGLTPKDWDITTNATPDKIQGLFEETFYENNFGTVGVKTRSEDDGVKVVEVTPYRTESSYSDNRRPDAVAFADTIEEDLSRRDFTVNALAYDPLRDLLVDEYKGQEDLETKTLKTVGDPDERFQEDALRMIRALRFTAQLGFNVSGETLLSIDKNKDLLKNVSRERIGDEFKKIINSKSPSVALGIAEKLNIIEVFAPVLRETVLVEQNKKAHKYDVWEHLVRSCQHAADKDFSFNVRVAALFHDIAKPATKRVDKNGKTSFFGHEVVGAKLTKEALEGLKFSRETIESITKLVRWHMFFSDTEEISLSAVRRLLAHVGEKDIWELIDLRKCDRIGSGLPKEEPYRLRQFIAMIDEVLHDPVSVGMLKMNGDILLEKFPVKPGKRVGWMLHAMLEEVLEDPTKNTLEYLSKKTEEYIKMDDEDLMKLGKQGVRKKNAAEEEVLHSIRRKRKIA